MTLLFFPPFEFWNFTVIMLIFYFRSVAQLMIGLQFLKLRPFHKFSEYSVVLLLIVECDILLKLTLFFGQILFRIFVRFH